MKSQTMKILLKTASFTIALGLLALLGGCGQKGPLVLPEKPTTNQSSN
ncbi:MAG: lipoprotein [Psychrosphaera sp.]|nr:lipoprotein [Psychrosphaera sp.]